MDSFKSRLPFKRSDANEVSKAGEVKEYGVPADTKELPAYDAGDVERRASAASYNISGVIDQTHRSLKPRHIQCMGAM